MSTNTVNLADQEEIDRFEQAVQTFFNGHIDADRFTAVRLQQGVYGQRQQGVNMLRIRIPGGRLAPEQLEALADVAETYSQRPLPHVTTRQSVQIHYVPLEKSPDALRRLAEAGLTTREVCGNAVRNMTACPLAGVCPREHVDVNTHVVGATKHFLRNPLNQQLPRKFKIAFSGCEADCAQTLLHDAGVIAVNKDGKQGFMVKAGGGLGHKPYESIVVEEFIPESEVLFALEALVALHNKYSDRTMRAKSRIKFLVERFGAEGFREKYREEFIRTKEALAGREFPKGEWRTLSPTSLPQAGESGKDSLRERQVDAGEIPGPGAPRKLFAQHQAGKFVLPIALRIGDITPAQLRGLAALMREHGLNAVHTTQDQNMALPDVAEEQIPSIREALEALELREPVTGDNVTACPGSSTCRLGITSSMVLGPKLSGGASDLRIRVSGCHNGCAQPETGDIGIYGEGKRVHGKLVPHYQIYLGGSGVGGGALALKGPALPAVRVEKAVARIEQAHRDSGSESFFQWAREQQQGYFKELLADLIEVKREEIESVMRDHGGTTDFRVVNLGGGECAGASQVTIGANFFEAAHEREYRNALAFQRKYDDAAHCNAAILNLLGNGLVQLLGGSHQDDLDQLSGQLREKVPGELAEEFARLAGQLGDIQGMTDMALAPISSAIDAWTVKAAEFCTTHDEQLDLSEALVTV